MSGKPTNVVSISQGKVSELSGENLLSGRTVYC